MDLLLTAPVGEQRDVTEAEISELSSREDALLSRLTKLLGTRANLSEVRLWLVTSLSDLPSPPATERLPRFKAAILTGNATDQSGPLQQLLQLFIEQYPDKCAAVLLQAPTWIMNFFSDDAHVTGWFSHFSLTDVAGFKHGSKALASYALKHRAEVWSHLVWQGKHSHTPVVVAAKPFYFSQLDIPATIAALQQHCPGFWESAELRDSLAAGDHLAMLPAFFVKELVSILGSGRGPSARLWEQLHLVLERHPYKQLCRLMLPHLNDAALLAFAHRILPPLAAQALPGGACELAQRLVFGCMEWKSLEEMQLFNALALHERGLKCLIAEAKDTSLVQGADSLCSLAAPVQWALWQHVARQQASALWKSVLLRRWATFMASSRRVAMGASEVENLLHCFGLGMLLKEKGEHASLGSGENPLEKDKHHRKKRKRKRARRYSPDSDSQSVGPELVAGTAEITLDGEQIRCQVLDLPSRLTAHAFCLWVRWGLSVTEHGGQTQSLQRH